LSVTQEALDVREMGFGLEDSMRTRGTRGSGLARSETVTVRLDPKLRYLAELAARKQRRTLSSFIEWAIERVLSQVLIREPGTTTISQVAEYLWDIDESTRLAKLAFQFPEMLTHPEQVLWKLIRENGFLWRGRYAESDQRWTWFVDEGDLLLDRLRDHWDTFRKVASGEADRSALPKWYEKPPPDEVADKGKSLDDDDIGL
jgi:hypothetical protein